MPCLRYAWSNVRVIGVTKPLHDGFEGLVPHLGLYPVAVLKCSGRAQRAFGGWPGHTTRVLGTGRLSAFAFLHIVSPFLAVNPEMVLPNLVTVCRVAVMS